MTGIDGKMTECVALIVAAGRGRRLGGPVPKAYRALGGMAVLRRSVVPFVDDPRVDAVRVVIHPDDRDLYEAATTGLSLLDPVDGGETRQESVHRGLESLAAIKPERVLIHDGARPLVDAGIIARVIDALATSPGAIAAVPVRDTLKRGDEGRISGTVDRDGLWRAQTPQGFRYAAILDAHQAAAEATPAEGWTDDAAVAERAGLDVALVAGSEENLKVTTEDDLNRAESLLTGAAAEVRVGMGFDAHRFATDDEAGDHVMLGGIAVPHDRRLLGHSDADVGLHALTDAILGAIGAGDIGIHFPPSEARWRGASSDTFLRHAVDLVTTRGGSILNLDLTLICERPRVGAHRAAMVARIAEVAGLARDRVSVKATTTERLGFAGRGEGIAAQAVATVRLPA